jgi:hypothetical protein
VCSCKPCERKRKAILQLLIQALWDVATFNLVKATFRRGVLLIFAESYIGRIMEFYFKKQVKMLVLLNSKYLFLVPITNFIIPTYIILINTLKC